LTIMNKHELWEVLMGSAIHQLSNTSLFLQPIVMRYYIRFPTGICIFFNEQETTMETWQSRQCRNRKDERDIVQMKRDIHRRHGSKKEATKETDDKMLALHMYDSSAERGCFANGGQTWRK
jgi:hypothetical protein